MISIDGGSGAILKIAVVGCGHWGKNLVRAFHECGALAAVHDANIETTGKLAKEYGVRVVSFSELLTDDAIPGVVIATPAETHFQLAYEALAADKHVFVEKPLALSISDGERLCEFAATQSRVLMVGHLLQYHPAFLRLLEIVKEGELGEIQYVYSNRLNLGKFRDREDALWSFAPHDISMVLSLIDERIDMVSAMGHNYLHKTIADVTVTHLKFDNGKAAHIFVSWLHPSKEHRLIVVGSNGMAVFDDTRDWTEKLCVFPHKIEWRDGVPSPKKAESVAIDIEAAEPLALECLHFLECMASGKSPRTDGAEGLEVLRVLDAADRSIRTGVGVSLVAQAPDDVFVHETSRVDPPNQIGPGTRIWHFCHVLKGCEIGRNCTVGQNGMIGPNVTIGDNCKIQNNVSIYEGVTLEDNVFCGPSAVFTNVINPRSEFPRKSEFLKTVVRHGASIGANATVVCGTTIGRYAFVGAGAVVTTDVPDFALVYGNPARVTDFMCACGEKLGDGDWKRTECRRCGRNFHRDNGQVKLLNQGIADDGR